MISRLLIPTLLAPPLCAQAPAPVSGPAVRIIIQADPPPAGTPVLDTATIAKALGDFANQHGFTAPAVDGDGWVLGVQLKTQAESKGLLAAGATLRLARVEKGQLVKDGVKVSGLIGEATSSGSLSLALAETLVQRAQRMLSDARLIPIGMSKPNHESSGSAPKMLERGPEFDFSQVKIAHMPPQPPYPPAAKAAGIQGKVIVEMGIDSDGKPESAVALEGPADLLSYAIEWGLRWRFIPMKINGQPTRGHFTLTMTFHLDSFLM